MVIDATRQPVLGLAVALPPAVAWASVAAAAALVLCAAAETLHARRTRRIARLAFGPKGQPAWWARSAPTWRVLGLAAAAWGAVALSVLPPAESDASTNPKRTKQLLICLDVSPSMLIADSAAPGDPLGAKVTRAARAGQVVLKLLDRVPGVSVSVYAFYTTSLPILQQSMDRELVAAMMDGLPMYTAFDPGPTDVGAGVRTALAAATPWERNSTTLVVISDGDTNTPLEVPALPAAIADTLVLGVGDVVPGTVAGHASRQESDALRALAVRLHGRYYNVNERHVPSSVLPRLTMTSPEPRTALGVREVAMAALASGSALLAILGPSLLRFGGAADSRRRASHSATPRAPPHRIASQYAGLYCTEKSLPVDELPTV